MHSGREGLRSRGDRGMFGVDIPDLSDDRHAAHGGEDGNHPIDRQSKIGSCPRHGRAGAMGTTL